MSINPVAFLVINNNNVKLMPVNHSSAIDKLLDYVPDLFEKVTNAINKCLDDKKEKVEKEKVTEIKEKVLTNDGKRVKIDSVTRRSK